MAYCLKDFIKNYLEQDRINKITIRRINDGTSNRTIAIVDVLPEGTKTVVLGKTLNFPYMIHVYISTSPLSFNTARIDSFLDI